MPFELHPRAGWQDVNADPVTGWMGESKLLQIEGGGRSPERVPEQPAYIMIAAEIVSHANVQPLRRRESQPNLI